MNNLTRTILLVISLLVLGFFLWYFSNIVTYIIGAGVLTLIGKPLVRLLGRIRIAGFKLPLWFSALITLVFLWFFVISFFRIFIPIVANEASELSKIDIDAFVDRLGGPVYQIEKYVQIFNPGGDKTFSFEQYIEDKLASVFQFSILSKFFSTIITFLGDIFVAVFSISFIAFFLLKGENLLTEAIVVLLPQQYEKNLREALGSVNNLLTRYLIGILIQLTSILAFVTLGMYIINLSFRQSLLIGLTAAILNIIPYLGPLIGSTLGVLLGFAFNINAEINELLFLGGKMILVFIIVHLIDNIITQPLVFSRSVRAHPLEIFLVILMAGSLAGISGMILAIPAYTIIRVMAKVFFNNFRIVKKLTQKM